MATAPRVLNKSRRPSAARTYRADGPHSLLSAAPSHCGREPGGAGNGQLSGLERGGRRSRSNSAGVEQRRPNRNSRGQRREVIEPRVVRCAAIRHSRRLARFRAADQAVGDRFRGLAFLIVRQAETRVWIGSGRVQLTVQAAGVSGVAGGRCGETHVLTEIGDRLTGTAV